MFTGKQESIYRNILPVSQSLFFPSGKHIMAVVLTSSVIQTRVLGTSGRPYWVEMRGMEPVQTRVPYLVHVYPAPWPSIQRQGECHPHSPKVIPQTKYQVFGKEVHCFTRMLLGTFGQYQTKCIYFFIFGEFVRFFFGKVNWELITVKQFLS